MKKRGMLPTVVIAVLASLTLIGTQGVLATHQPADKVVASGSKAEVLSPGEEVPILTGTLRSTNTTDLILGVSLECSIFTALTTGPSDSGGTDSAFAQGHILVWVEIDGQIVPINSLDGASAPGDDSDKVTFCDRTYQRTVTDAEDPLDGQDIEEDYIRTKNANAFNWLRLNVGNGIHSIVVKATLKHDTKGEASAEAVIGNRTLVVEPTRLANDATV